MNFNEFSRNELNRRFNGTYVYSLKHEKPCRVLGIGSNIEYQINHLGKRAEERSEAFSLAEWDLSYPKLGFIPHGDYAIHLSRVPYRQYKYGFDPGLLKKEEAGLDVARYLGLGSYVIPKDKKLIASIFDRKVADRYVPYDVAYKTLMEGSKASVPLSENLAMVLSLVSRKPLIYNGTYRLVIGQATSINSVLIHRKAKFLKEDLESTLRVNVEVL
jgi:hypothetical protein